MGILKQLGLDSTVGIQLIYFLISYIFLSKFLFKPYQRNLKYRKENTSGSVDEAAKLALQTDTLVNDYQIRMRDTNDRASEIYSQIKSEGHVEEDRVLTQARAEASELNEKTKNKIAEDLKKARTELSKQTPELAALIASRVLGRDLQ